MNNSVSYTHHLQCITLRPTSNLDDNHLMIKYVILNSLHDLPEQVIENNFAEKLISQRWKAIWITGLTDNEREQVGIDDWLSFERAPIVSHLIAHKDKYENLLFTDLGKKAMSNFMKELTGHLNCRVHIAPGDDIQFYSNLKHFICGSPYINAMICWGWRYPLTQQGLEKSIAEALCDDSSIEHIYMSNHTLENVWLVGKVLGRELLALLSMNTDRNKVHVCMRKILCCNPIIDVKPLFKWNMEGQREQNLKALPSLIAWFDKATEAVLPDESYDITGKKLNLIYQFACAMPLLFIPASHGKVHNTKRKRDNYK